MYICYPPPPPAAAAAAAPSPTFRPTRRLEDRRSPRKGPWVRFLPGCRGSKKQKPKKGCRGSIVWADLTVRNSDFCFWFSADFWPNWATRPL